MSKPLIYWCGNAAILAWSLLFYFQGTPVWVAVVSALVSLVLLNGTVWFVSRRTGAFASSTQSHKHPMAFWFGVILVCLGAIAVGTGAWAKISGTRLGLGALDGIIPLAFGTYVVRRYRRRHDKEPSGPVINSSH